MELPTQTHLTVLRNLLTYRLGELRAQVRAAQRERAAEIPLHDVTDRKDDAEQALAAQMSAAEAQRDIDELRDVQAALARLDDGSYGDCLDCGEPIPLQRLLVQPAALRCAACQAAHERAARSHG